MNNSVISTVFIIFVLGLLGSSLLSAAEKQQPNNTPIQQEITVPSRSAEPILSVSPTPIQPPLQIQRKIFRGQERGDDD